MGSSFSYRKRAKSPPIKAAYAEMQMARHPYNSDAIQAADQAVVEELRTLSEAESNAKDYNSRIRGRILWQGRDLGKLIAVEMTEYGEKLGGNGGGDGEGETAAEPCHREQSRQPWCSSLEKGQSRPCDLKTCTS